MAVLKGLPSHYVLQLGYPSCDYPHIRPCEMYLMAHLEGLNDLSDPLKQIAASVRSEIQARLRPDKLDFPTVMTRLSD